MKYNILLYKGKAKDFRLDKCDGYDKIKMGDKICKENIMYQKTETKM